MTVAISQSSVQKLPHYPPLKERVPDCFGGQRDFGSKTIWPELARSFAFQYDKESEICSV